MNRVLGIGLGARRARAILVRDGEAEWAAEVETAGDDESALRRLLAEAPIASGVRPSVRAALGPWASRITRLDSLPAELDQKELDRLLEENATTFFLKNGTPLVTTAVRRIGGNGTGCGAAFHGPVVDALAHVAAEHRLRLESVSPAAVALLAATPDQALAWDDDGLTLRVERREDGVPHVRTRFGDAGASPPTPVEGLASIGERAGDFADAYGATFARPGEPLVYVPPGATAFSARPGRLGRALLALAGLASLAALLAPARFNVEAGRIESSLDELRGPNWGRVTRASRDLERISVQLAAVMAATDAPLITPLLAALTEALPDGAAVTSLDVEAGGARLEILAPNAARLVEVLAASPVIRTVSLDGPIEREMSEEIQLERATLVIGIGSGQPHRDRATTPEGSP